MASEFTLHGSPHSQFTYKVALMLRLAGVAFTFRYVSFQKGMQRTPEFRALSRWGQVPVLEHRGRALCQSGAILEYLAETLGVFGARDMPGRQRIREWLYWNADRLAPPISGCYGVKLGERKLLPIAFDPAIAASFRHRAGVALTALDANLAGSAFVAADTPTIADIACYGDVAFAALAEIDLEGWDAIGRWSERIARLPGFRAPFDLLTMADAKISPA